MKEIEKQLKKEGQSLLPDEALKNKIEARAFGETTSVVEPKKGLSALGRHKALIFSVAAAVVVAVISLVLILGPVDTSGNGGGHVGPGPSELPIKPPQEAVVTKEVKEAYTFGAYSAGLLLSGGGTGGAFASASEATESQINDVAGYMQFIDGVMASTPSSVEKASDREGYATKLTITQTLFGGESKVCIIYFNESAKKEDDGEISSTFKGVMLMDGREYTVDGTREREYEDGESEYEIEMRIGYGERSTLVFEQEIEEDETEYLYGFYEDGVLMESFELSVETEYGASEVELTVIRGTTKTELKYVADKNSSAFTLELFFGNAVKAERIDVTCGTDGYTFVYNGTETKFVPYA